MPGWLVYITDVIGIGAAAVSGAMIAIERKLDLFGIFFLGMITALGGGVMRDLLLGATPPLFFTSYFALLVVAIAVAIVFIIARIWNGWRNPEIKHRIDQIHNLFDAIGLSAFTITGVQVAMSAGYNENAFLCVFMGMTTGIGGGVLRDMIIRQTPYVLRKRVYALASIIGALLFWSLSYWGVSTLIAQPVSILLIVLIRVCATIFRWNLPRVHLADEELTNSNNEKDQEIK